MSDPTAPRRDTRPILVATDGTTAGEAAFRAAALTAAKVRSTVQVVVVVEPLPVVVPERSLMMEPLVASPTLLDAIRDRVVSQMRPLASQGLEWHVQVEYGRPSAEIVDKAHDLNTQLIVMGLVHHNVVDRILDGDTALEVVRHSQAPLLLASAGWKALPKVAVVAVDFSTQSLEAAHAGMRLLGDGATIILVHVRSVVTVYDGMAMWEEEYDTAATKELGKFAEALNVSSGIRVETVMLSGNPSAAILDFANERDADLIVSGTRGAGLIERLVVGSVATRLMHHSTRSLLIVPETAQ
jgi:nucleotide-binding universal stress UspA family protein